MENLIPPLGYRSRYPATQSAMLMLGTIEISKLSLCDAEFRGFRWQNNDLDIYLNIASSDITEIRCHWASNLTSNLKWTRNDYSVGKNPPRRGGPLLTFDGSLTRNDTDRWVLLLNFAHDGTLALECEKVSSLIIDNTPQ